MYQVTAFRSLCLLLLFLAAAHQSRAQPQHDLLGQVLPAAQPQRQPHAQLRQIVVVFKTHFDIGYSNLARNVVKQYRTSMIDRTLDVIRQNRRQPELEQFVWTVPGWPMSQMLWEGQSPQRRKVIEQAIKDGHLVIHGLPFTTHTETLGLEDLVRGLGFSSSLARRYGLPLPRDAKMTDVPCHTWLVPTLLKHAGIEFIHVGCNDASMPPRVPLLFWWEGPDGSRTLTMLTNTYGTWPLPPAGWTHKTWLALLHTGDNQGPPRPEHVRSVIETYRREVPQARVKIGRMSDFADALLAEKPDLPVVRGDMPDTWIHGPVSAPAGCKTARNVRPALTATELLGTHLLAWGAPVGDSPDTLAEAYEKSLLYGEHTWGLATQHYVKLVYGDQWRKLLAAGLDRNHRYLEESWDEHEAYINHTRKLIQPLLAERLGLLARQVNVTGRRIVVYNPLPWRRSGLVRVSAGRQVYPLKPLDGDRVEPVAVQDRTMCFVARDVPPLGYRTYVPTPTKAPPPAELAMDAASKAIESPFFKALLDPQRGVVRSLIDKGTGRELVDASASCGLGQYLYERHGRQDNQAYLKAYVPPRFHRTHAILMCKENVPDAPYAAARPHDMELKLGQDALSVWAEISSRADDALPHDVSIRLTLYRHRPVADFEINLDKPADPWPESGWFCFPLAVDRPSYRLGRLGSIVDPTRDIVEGTNFHLLWLESGITVTDPAGQGVGLCPVDLPLVSLGQPGMLRYSRRYLPKQPHVYVNLFNNHWNTNFRSWYGGTVSARVRLWTVDRFDAEKDLITPGWQARSPLLAAAADGPAGTLPPSRTGLELSRKGLLVTAFGPNPDGPGTVLRLWEQAGQGGPCHVRLPQGFDVQSVQPADLRGRPLGKPIDVEDRAFTVQIRAFAPASLLIER